MSWCAVDVAEDASRCCTDKHISIFVFWNAPAADIKTLEIAGIGSGCCIGHDNMCQSERPRGGARPRRSRIFCVDAVIEYVELQCGFVPEQDWVDTRWPVARYRTG